MNNNLFLGFDCSTQSFKVIVIDIYGKIIYQDKIIFHTDLSRYNTDHGVYYDSSENVITSPVLMWIEAFDLLLSKMSASNFPFHMIRAISGCAQQHTSIYWNKLNILNNLDSTFSLKEQFDNISTMFVIKNSPTWMDSSTTKQCREFESAISGGASQISNITGSIAYERFTGMQIKKLYQNSSELYNQCERISLLSSFFTSLLIQDYASIDYSDGAGMNLMNIHTKVWDQNCLDAIAPMLREKLGDLQPSHNSAGNIGSYFVKKYGFHFNTQIIHWSGDNPCSLAGLCLKNNEIAINLGTSDTIFGITKNPVLGHDIGHVFPNPIDPESFMVMLCFKNGDLTRNKIKGNISWTEFNKLLLSTPPGNNGYRGLYYDYTEITPPNVIGYFRFDPSGNQVESFNKEVEIRSLIEGQFLSMHKYSNKLGIKTEKIIATGGASVNKEILKILSSIFNCDVYSSINCETSLLGAAYRAIHGYKCFKVGRFISFNSINSFNSFNSLSNNQTI
jgi:xylulokinase